MAKGKSVNYFNNKDFEGAEKTAEIEISDAGAVQLVGFDGDPNVNKALDPSDFICGLPADVQPLKMWEIDSKNGEINGKRMFFFGVLPQFWKRSHPNTPTLQLDDTQLPLCQMKVTFVSCPFISPFFQCFIFLLFLERRRIRFDLLQLLRCCQNCPSRYTGPKS